MAMQTMAAARKAAETSSRFAVPSGAAASAVIVGPAMAPQLPPAAMAPYRRAACAASNRSAMKLQNTDTTNRLNTLTQTKNAGASAFAATPDSSAAQNKSRLAAKKPYTAGSRRARGSRAHSQPYSGTSSSIVTKVAVNSHGSCAVPACTPISSRTGRST